MSYGVYYGPIGVGPVRVLRLKTTSSGSVEREPCLLLALRRFDTGHSRTYEEAFTVGESGARWVPVSALVTDDLSYGVSVETPSVETP